MLSNFSPSKKTSPCSRRGINTPKFKQKPYSELKHTLQGIFGEENAPVSLFFVPTYPTGMWSFQYGLKGSKQPNSISNFDEINAFVSENNLRYYNAEIHVGSFATPNFVKDLLKK